MVATAITLVLMSLVVGLFAYVGDAVRNTRATVQMVDQMRSTRLTFESDLAGITARMFPPLRPEFNLGYFEYIEGPIIDPTQAPDPMPAFPLTSIPVPAQALARVSTENRDGIAGADPDWTAGDSDDVLMFTTRSRGEPFVGRFGQIDINGNPQSVAIQSQVAEVAWFVRGATLYRRVLLVVERPPDFDLRTAAHDPPGAIPPTPYVNNFAFYGSNDLSVHQEGEVGSTPYVFERNPVPGPLRIVPNSLGDLTKRENRFGHQPFAWPHASTGFWGQLRLPTLRECSDPAWPFPLYDVNNVPIGSTQGAAVPTGGVPIIPAGPAPPLGYPVQPNHTASGVTEFDAWLNPHPWTQVYRRTGTIAAYPNGIRLAEDVILNNVLTFDVKAWDPGAPVYVDATTGQLVLPGDPAYRTMINGIDSAGNPLVPLPTPQSFGAYVDLNYSQLPQTAAAGPTTVESVFDWAGNYGPAAGTPAAWQGILPMVYDTWSTHYEQDGLDQDGDGVVDEGTDGFDNDQSGVGYGQTTALTGTGTGGVDDGFEREAPPPYPVPLRGIQIRIRCFEPDSRQIREMTIVQEFLPE